MAGRRGLTSIGLREKLEQPVVSVSTAAKEGAPILKVTSSDTRPVIERLKAMPTGSATTLQVDDALSFSALLELLDVSTRAGLSVTLKRSAPALIAEGSLNPDLIHKVVVSHKAKVRACFDQVLTSFSKLDGKAVLKLTIAADGTVSTAVAESTSNTELSNCIAERVKTWVFPKPKGGGVVITTYPFKLSAK